MKIIISPAKQMKVDTDTFKIKSQPIQLNKAEEIESYLKSLTLDQLRTLWHTNDKLFDLNIKRLQKMDLKHGAQTPAILAYSGLQYQYMAPDLFTQEALNYTQKYLRILSSFYGVLRPFDGIVPYRLEMRAKAHVNGTKNLHEFWGKSWFNILTENNDVIINLASEVYADQISRYIIKETNIQMISCVFGYYNEDKVMQDNTYAKMARGEMVRYMAENDITDFNELKEFKYFGYKYNAEYSTTNKLVFIRKGNRRRTK